MGTVRPMVASVSPSSPASGRPALVMHGSHEESPVENVDLEALDGVEPQPEQLKGQPEETAEEHAQQDGDLEDVTTEQLLEDLQEQVTSSFYGYVTVILTDYKSKRWLRALWLFAAYVVVCMQIFTILAMMITSMFPRCQPRDQGGCPTGTVCTGVWSVYYGKAAYPAVAWEGIVSLYDYWGEDYKSGPAPFSNYRFFCEDCKATTQVDYWTSSYPSMAGQNLYDSLKVVAPQDELDKCNCSLWQEEGGEEEGPGQVKKKGKGKKAPSNGGYMSCDADGNPPAGCAYARNMKLQTDLTAKIVFLLIAAATGCACVVEKRQCTIHEYITSSETWRLRDGLKRGCFDFDFITLYLLWYLHYILRPVLLYVTTASVCTIITFNDLVDANSVVLDGLSIVFILEVDDIVFSAMSFSRMHKNMFNVQLPFLTKDLDLYELVDRVYYRTFFCYCSTFAAIIFTLFWFVSEAMNCSRLARHMLFWPCICTLFSMVLELALPLIRPRPVSSNCFVPTLHKSKSRMAKFETVAMWLLKFFFVFFVFDVGMREGAYTPRIWHVMWKSKYGVSLPQEYTPTGGAALGLQGLWGFA